MVGYLGLGYRAYHLRVFEWSAADHDSRYSELFRLHRRLRSTRFVPVTQLRTIRDCELN